MEFEYRFITNIYGMNGDIFPVLFSPKFIHDCGYSVAAIGKVCMEDGVIRPCIIVDQEYMSAPGYLKKFVRLHELGHYYNGDLDIPKKEMKKMLKDRFSGICPPQELAADKFAAEHMRKGAAYEAAAHMKKVGEHFSTGPNNIGAKELVTRADQLLKSGVAVRTPLYITAPITIGAMGFVKMGEYLRNHPEFYDKLLSGELFKKKEEDDSEE